MAKRFLFYIKGFSKPMALTDPNEKRSIKELNNMVSELLTSTEMCEFSTKLDGFIARPTDIVGVYITELDKNSVNTDLYDETVNDLILSTPKKVEIVTDKIEFNNTHNQELDFDTEEDSNEIDIPSEVLDCFEDNSPISAKNIATPPNKISLKQSPPPNQATLNIPKKTDGYGFPEGDPVIPDYMLEDVPGMNQTNKSDKKETKVFTTRPVVIER